MTPFLAHRFASNIALRTEGAATTDELRFEGGQAAGFLINTDLAGRRSQYLVYYSHQRANVRLQVPTAFGGLAQFDVAIDRLQIGGLYFPGGGFGGSVLNEQPPR